jgi:hypothetical protein
MFFGGSLRVIIIENLKAAAINRLGRVANINSKLLALYGHYYL